MLTVNKIDANAPTVGAISLKRDGYDPFIDFLKGVCIIFVILNHCLPSLLQQYTLFPLWGGNAVPIFLLIQVFHSYKRGVSSSKVNFSKLWNRIIRPFLFTEFVILSVCSLELYFEGKSVSDFLSTAFYGGGRGPGSYYPWIYVQFAIILPLMSFVFEKYNAWQLLVIFIIVSQVFEMLSSLVNIPDWPYYSLSFVRYTFLFYLGYLMASDKIFINKYTLFLSLLSIIITIIFVFFPINLSPVFRSNMFWKNCHWPCYVFVPYILIGLLKLIYKKLQDGIVAFTIVVGKSSYEIFLFQLFYFMVIATKLRNLLAVIGNNYVEISLYIILSVLVCTLPILYFTNKKTNILFNK